MSVFTWPYQWAFDAAEGCSSHALCSLPGNSLISSPAFLLTLNKPGLTSGEHWLTHQANLSKENIGEGLEKHQKLLDVFWLTEATESVCFVLVSSSP